MSVVLDGNKLAYRLYERVRNQVAENKVQYSLTEEDRIADEIDALKDDKNKHRQAKELMNG